jgi:hypothetical protein
MSAPEPFTVKVPLLEVEEPAGETVPMSASLQPELLAPVVVTLKALEGAETRGGLEVSKAAT